MEFPKLPILEQQSKLKSTQIKTLLSCVLLWRELLITWLPKYWNGQVISKVLTFGALDVLWYKCSLGRRHGQLWRIVFNKLSVILFLVYIPLCHLKFLNNVSFFYNLVSIQFPLKDYQQSNYWIIDLSKTKKEDKEV